MSSPPPGRPTVDQVGRILLARTKDDQGHEVGTFDSTTRPTDVEVDGHIDAAMALIAPKLPLLDKLPPDLLPSVAEVVAYRAALRIEKAYWPEQVRQNRSAYDQLNAEYQEDLASLIETAEAAAGGSEYEMAPIVSLKVGSWTSIPQAGGVFPA